MKCEHVVGVELEWKWKSRKIFIRFLITLSQHSHEWYENKNERIHAEKHWVKSLSEVMRYEIDHVQDICYKFTWLKRIKFDFYTPQHDKKVETHEIEKLTDKEMWKCLVKIFPGNFSHISPTQDITYKAFKTFEKSLTYQFLNFLAFSLVCKYPIKRVELSVCCYDSNDSSFLPPITIEFPDSRPWGDTFTLSLDSRW